MLADALRYASLRWRVFPLYEPIAQGVCSCRKRDTCGRDTGKHPRTPHGLTDATTDAAQIRAWWSAWPSANIGVRTGDGLYVVDVDGDKGGEESFATLGDLPVTVEASTGNGRHLFFATSKPLTSTKGRLGRGIDTRGQGGYVVAPPSLHLTGRRYAWIRPPWECALAALPARIVESTRAHCVLPDGDGCTRGEGHNGGARGGPDASDSGDDARETLRLIRRGATDAEIANVLRDRASYRKRLSRGERIAEDYLRRTIVWGRAQPVVDPWAGSIRVRVVRAAFERLSARPWVGQAASERVNLWVATEDGEVLDRQQVYLHATDVYAKTLGDIPQAAWLDARDGGRELAAKLVGREIEIVIDPGQPRARLMRRR
jgi:hypothetical protein